MAPFTGRVKGWGWVEGGKAEGCEKLKVKKLKGAAMAKWKDAEVKRMIAFMIDSLHWKREGLGMGRKSIKAKTSH